MTWTLLKDFDATVRDADDRTHAMTVRVTVDRSTPERPRYAWAVGSRAGAGVFRHQLTPALIALGARGVLEKALVRLLGEAHACVAADRAAGTKTGTAATKVTKG